MAIKVVQKNTTQREPIKGTRGPAIIMANFALSTTLSRMHVLRSANSSIGRMRAAVQRMITTEYNNSGLNIISGDLIASAKHDFKIQIVVSIDKIVTVKVLWRPDVKYLFMQLFGIDGTNHRAHRFIKWNTRLLEEIAKILERELVTVTKRTQRVRAIMLGAVAVSIGAGGGPGRPGPLGPLDPIGPGPGPGGGGGIRGGIGKIVRAGVIGGIGLGAGLGNIVSKIFRGVKRAVKSIVTKGLRLGKRGDIFAESAYNRLSNHAKKKKARKEAKISRGFEDVIRKGGPPNEGSRRDLLGGVPPKDFRKLFPTERDYAKNLAEIRRIVDRERRKRDL